MYWTWHAPPTLLELGSPKRGAVGRRNWAQQLGPPHRPPLGGESRPKSPCKPWDDLPVGEPPSPCSLPTSLGSQAGEGGRLGPRENVERGLVLGVTSESEVRKEERHSPSTTTSWHTLWLRMHRPHTRLASPKQACPSLAHRWHIGMRHARWPCVLEVSQETRKTGMARHSLPRKSSNLGESLASQPTAPCPGRLLRGPAFEPWAQRALEMAAPARGQLPTGPPPIRHRWGPLAHGPVTARQSRSCCGRSNPWPPERRGPSHRRTREVPSAGWPSSNTKYCAGKCIQYPTNRKGKGTDSHIAIQPPRASRPPQGGCPIRTPASFGYGPGSPGARG